MAIHASKAGAKERFKGLFFTTPELNQRLDLLRHLTENSDFVLLVRGGSGAGKTSMLYQLLALGGEHWAICRIDANPLLHPDQLLSQCATQLALFETGDQVRERVVQCFVELRQAGRIPVIVIDDAHLLPPATLILLMRLYEKRCGDFPLVRILLFGNPEIDDLLAKPQLQATKLQQLYVLDLPRLSQQQIPKFVNYVLAEQGEGENAPLSALEVRRLYRASGGGVPGRLTELVRTSLPQQAASRPKGSGNKLLANAWLSGGAVVVVVLVLALSFQDKINRFFNPDAVSISLPQKPMANVETALPLAVEESRNSVAAAGEEMSATSDAPPPLLPLPRGKNVSFPADDLVTRSRSALDESEGRVSLPQIAADEPQTPDDALGSVAYEPIDAGASTETIAAEREAPASASLSGEVLPSEPEEATATRVIETAPDETAAEATQRTSEPLTPTEHGSDPRAAPEKPPAENYAPTPGKRMDQAKQAPAEDSSQKLTDSGMRKEAWLLEQRPAAYTLQLIGVREEVEIVRFAKRHGLQESLVYFETRRRGKPWFSALYGVFPGRKAAFAGQAELPPRLRNKDVWVRSFRAIQKEIRARMSRPEHKETN